MSQDALWNDPKTPVRKGRNERAIDSLAKAMHEKAEKVDAWQEACLMLARSQARAVDLLENSPSKSRYALGPIGRVLLDVLTELKPEASDSDGDLDGFLADMRAAMVDQADGPTV